MPSSGAIQRKIPVAPLVIGALVVVGLIAALAYLRAPAPATESGPASPEAKAYTGNLVLSDVGMRATENFMQQQVVEIEGKIANEGARVIDSVDVYCLFRAADGHEIYRERARIVSGKPAPFVPKETRPFRLAFDHLPDGWNQAMPTLVIAQIVFARR
ncbi:MAG: hypothetical protein JOY62_00360 [Acidobacteriaceae bacterium]|nr:hypothetical protein [Acidobacteriaceae bacterium]MBV9778396.1 hypothetical protein [Acidobacteriaceae bacterium]